MCDLVAALVTRGGRITRSLTVGLAIVLNSFNSSHLSKALFGGVAPQAPSSKLNPISNLSISSSGEICAECCPRTKKAHMIQWALDHVWCLRAYFMYPILPDQDLSSNCRLAPPAYSIWHLKSVPIGQWDSIIPKYIKCRINATRLRIRLQISLLIILYSNFKNMWRLRRHRYL